MPAVPSPTLLAAVAPEHTTEHPASTALPPGRQLPRLEALARLQPEDADPLLQRLAQQLGVGGLDPVSS